MDSSLLDILGHSGDKSISIFEICVEIGLVDYRTGLRLEMRYRITIKVIRYGSIMNTGTGMMFYSI